MTATNEAVFTTAPRPRSSRCGMPYLQHRYTEVRLTSCTRRQASSSVSRIESSSGGEMPALLTSTSIPPKRATAAAYMPCTSSAEVTSARTNSPSISSASALPPSSSRSATTTCAPSAANRRALARPMPLAAPVMTATLPSSLPANSPPLSGRDLHTRPLPRADGGECADLAAATSSQALESPESLPVGHRGVVGGELHAGGVRVVVDHIVAEGLACRCAGLEQLAGVAQRRRHARLVGGVRVARERLLQRQLLLDAVQAGGDGGGQGQVGVHVAAGHPVLHPQRRAVPDHPQRAGAVVEPPCHRGGREAAQREPLVRVDVRRHEQGELP